MNARDRARELFKDLSDSMCMSGRVWARARDFVPAAEAAIEQALADEREACAKLADAHCVDSSDEAEEIAAAIRARAAA